MLKERGAVAVTVALCLVLFCGMAALAVDLGFGSENVASINLAPTLPPWVALSRW